MASRTEGLCRTRPGRLMAMMAALILLPALSAPAAEAAANAAAPEKPLRIVWGPFLGMVCIDGKKLKMDTVGPDKKVIDSLELQKP